MPPGFYTIGLYWLHLHSKVGEVPTVRYSDTDANLPIISAELFHKFKKQCNRFIAFQMVVFKAIKSLHRLNYVVSYGIVLLHRFKWQMLKRYNRFITNSVASSLQNSGWEAIQWLHRSVFFIFLSKGIFVGSVKIFRGT